MCKGRTSGPGVTAGPAAGCDIPTVQELLGHRELKTMMIWTHVLNRGGRGVHSPADVLFQPEHCGDHWYIELPYAEHAAEELFGVSSDQ
jgi:hypothetical protein